MMQITYPRRVLFDSTISLREVRSISHNFIDDFELDDKFLFENQTGIG